MVTFTLGADPEVFLMKGGKPVSAHETAVTGTKSSPQKTSNGAVQIDGTALEFNIDPVLNSNFEGFNLNIVKTLKDMKELTPGYNISKVAVQDYGFEYLASLPDAATELGCDPDYDAYTGKPNPRPNGALPFRSGAGHVHIGWGADIPVANEEHIEICCDFVKMLDATAGMFMTYIDREPRRRELYGKAGAFRPKPYGVEYRTPSNAWIWSRDRRLVMHTMINQAIRNQTQGLTPARAAGFLSEREIVDVINDGDFERAIRAVYRLMPYGHTAARTALDRIVDARNKQEKAKIDAAEIVAGAAAIFRDFAPAAPAPLDQVEAFDRAAFDRALDRPQQA